MTFQMDGPCRYKLSDIKPGDWVVVGDGRMAVGWSSVLDRDENRTIRKVARRVKSVRKSVVLESKFCGTDRVEVEQVIGVFDSQGRAQEAVDAAMESWHGMTDEIERLQRELNAARRSRFKKSYEIVARRTNR